MSQGKTKKTAFLQQSQEILKRTQALFKERQKMTNTKVVFYKASRVEHVKPMFELVWMNFLVTFSGPMQDSEVPESHAKHDDARPILKWGCCGPLTAQDPALLSLCLEGFLYAFQISSMFYLDLQKNGAAFVDRPPHRHPGPADLLAACTIQQRFSRRWSSTPTSLRRTPSLPR